MSFETIIYEAITLPPGYIELKRSLLRLLPDYLDCHPEISGWVGITGTDSCRDLCLTYTERENNFRAVQVRRRVGDLEKPCKHDTALVAFAEVCLEDLDDEQVSAILRHLVNRNGRHQEITQE